jgi:hypothetical protein
MDKNSTFVVHYNKGLKNQVLYAEYLNEGFDRIDRKCVLTDDRNYHADIHVCIGPHYALRECIGKPTIYIDRCLWGDDLEFVTIGWLDSKGYMIYPQNQDGGRPKPKLSPWKVSHETRDALYCLDYGPYPLENIHKLSKQVNLTIRPHPATKKNQPTLIQHMKSKHVIIGNRTSALVTAAIKGYPVVCFDEGNAVSPVAARDILNLVYPDRTQWLSDLSYAQWSGKEIESGEALEYAISNFTNSRANKPFGGEKATEC